MLKINLSVIALFAVAFHPQVSAAGLLSNVTAIDGAHSVNASSLVDGESGNTLPQWAPSQLWSSGSYPMSATLDLGQDYSVSQIKLFHGNGGNNQGQILIQYLPLNSTQYVSIENHHDSVWNSYAIVNAVPEVLTRRLKLTISSAETFYNVSEVQVFGTALSGNTPPAPTPADPAVPAPTAQPPATQPPLASGQITTITASNIQNSVNASVLVDRVAGNSQAQWESPNVWSSAGFPMIAQLDLGAVYDVSKISFFHGNGGSGDGHILVSYLPTTAASGQFVDLVNHSDGVWNNYAAAIFSGIIKTRYLQLKIASVGTYYNLSEVMVMGSPSGGSSVPPLTPAPVLTPAPTATPAPLATATPIPVPVVTPSPSCMPLGMCAPQGACPLVTPPNYDARGCQISCAIYSCNIPTPATGSRITVDQFLGINAFNDDPIDKMLAVGFVREYHNWAWDEGDIWSGGGNRNYSGYPNNKMKFAPSEAGGGYWNFDQFYGQAKTAGLTVSPVIQDAPAWLQGGLNFSASNKPIDQAGQSTTSANSYQAKSHHMYQFAARYGATSVADSLLTLESGQARNSGMGLLNYIEDYNEQDKNWMGSGAEFSAQEYAAMLSADYDGHGRTMHGGTGTFGVKNADPSMKLAMGGIFRLNLDYIRQMKAWFEANRVDRKFAADVINVHDYAWGSNAGPGGNVPALSPEEWGWKDKLAAFTQYRNQNLPGVEVWISEFGYDTNPNSALRVPNIPGFDREDVQGQWLVRGYLAFAAAGVDRAMMFMFRDDNSNDSTAFASSGLVGEKGTWTPKKSWYYVYTMKNMLRNMVFAGEQASTDPNLLIYKFKDQNGQNGAYVVWSKTKQNYVVNNYRLPLQGSPTTASLTTLTSGSTTGSTTVLPISASSVSFTASEKPVFIKVDKIQ